MTNSYTLASLNNHGDIIKEISRYESELKNKLGQDIVLIAYAKSDSNSDIV